jgi:hypothetical protein
MHGPLNRRIPHTLAACTLLVITIGSPARAVLAGERGEPVTPAALTKAVNQLVPADIPIAAAASMPCASEQLPRSLAKLLPLLPSAHRDLIGECAQGRTRIDRAVSTFDLLAALEDPANRPAAVARVRSFFDGRPVDVAAGTGLSDEPYPISFDWIVVLDPQSKTLFSFVLNCHD